MAWLTGWSKRKAITLATPAALLSAFPFPAAITADTDVGALAQATGYDIRFTLADGSTLLDYERDTFAVTAGAATGLWWVEIPSWSALVATTIYMYYGNASAPDVSSGPNTFDSNHVGVYHGGDGTTLSVQDSSPAANHGTNSGATAAAGIAGGAMSCDGSADYVTLTQIAFAIRSAFTLSAWVTKTTTVDLASIFGGIAGGNAPALRVEANGSVAVRFTGSTTLTAAGAVPQNTATHISVTRAATTGALSCYVNGVDATSGTPAADAAFVIDYIGKTDAGRFWPGLLDELRIDTSVRSVGWRVAEYGTVAAPASWQTWGAEESDTVGGWFPISTRRGRIIHAA